MPQSRWELEYEAVTAIPEADRLDRYSSDSGCWHYLFRLENFGCTNKTFISVLFLRLMTTSFVLCLYNFEFAKLRVKHCIERNLVYQHQTANPDFSSKSTVTNVICDECYCIRRSIHWLNILKNMWRSEDLHHSVVVTQSRLIEASVWEVFPSDLVSLAWVILNVLLSECEIKWFLKWAWSNALNKCGWMFVFYIWSRSLT